MMKRLFVFLCALAVLHSCILEYSDGPSVNPYKLELYTDEVFRESVQLPFFIVLGAVELNGYIQATEEERLDARFDRLRQNILHITDNEICIRDLGVFVVTGNLETVDAEWNYGEDGAKVVRLDDGWTFVKKGKGQAELDALFERTDEAGMWLASVSGRTDIENGLWAEFTTGDAPLSVRYSWGSSTDVSYAGNFMLDITGGTEKLDYCHVKWFSSGGREVVTSR